MARLPDLDPIDFLTARKFPKPPPTVLASLTTHSPSIPFRRHPPLSEEERRQREYQIAKYHQELQNMPPEELQALFESEVRKNKEEWQAKREAEEKLLFFNSAAADADFDHWSRAAHWTLEEAVALSFGKDPKQVNWRSISTYENVSPFPKKYADRLDLARRAILWQKLFDPVLPGIFIGWARDNEIEFPDQLEALVRTRGNFVGSWKSNFEALLESHNALQGQTDQLLESHASVVRQRDEALARLAESQNFPASSIESGCGVREKESLLKLVIGLAIGGYGYDPKSSRNAKASEMANDLVLAGVPLDDDTIRKWLRAGAELLPPKEAE
jgi:hypothetical protein